VSQPTRKELAFDVVPFWAAVLAFGWSGRTIHFYDKWLASFSLGTFSSGAAAASSCLSQRLHSGNQVRHYPSV
jgi:hypothetical protein